MDKKEERVYINFATAFLDITSQNTLSLILRIGWRTLQIRLNLSL